MAKTKGPRFYRQTKEARAIVRDLQSLLSSYSAVKSFHVALGEDGPTGIAFQVETSTGDLLPVKLQPNPEGVRRRAEDKGVTIRVSAEAVAWRLLYAQAEVMLELLENEVLTPEEAFGGLALTDSGLTVAEIIRERSGELLPGDSVRLLPGG